MGPYLIYSIDAWDVNPAPLNDIDQVINLIVLSAKDVSIVNAVLGADGLGRLQVDLGVDRS